LDGSNALRQALLIDQRIHQRHINLRMAGGLCRLESVSLFREIRDRLPAKRMEAEASR